MEKERISLSSTKTYIGAVKAGFGEGYDPNYAVQISNWKKYWKATDMTVFVDMAPHPLFPSVNC